MDLAPFFSRHSKIALFFSGGKDSLALLELCRPFKGKFVILWGNPGNPPAETLEIMLRVQEEFPDFVTVHGQQPEFVKKFGHPVSEFTDRKGFQFFQNCCWRNLWEPTAVFIKQHEITGVLRGQKLSDLRTNGILSGAVIDGVEYCHPLENWSDAQVIEFLGDKLPQSYREGLKETMHCLNCTAYPESLENRLTWLAPRYPAVHTEIVQTLQRYKHG